ncbi:MAG: ABC transporter permease, partial [Candidatus Atribacteria bacterium]|nr:ABC transporter permease [Candidatus Atribacteria bacterium]MCD6350266.1 ABC transporter permease [Candidatus Atribacteria bacterium]
MLLSPEEKNLPQEKDSAVTNFFRRSDTSVILATIGLFLLFALSSESFFSVYNIFNVTRTASLYIFVALGQVMALVVGGMNLSVGAIGGLSVITAGYLMHTLGYSGWVAVPAAFAIGIACGFFNGILITKLKLNSFVVT